MGEARVNVKVIESVRQHAGNDTKVAQFLINLLEAEAEKPRSWYTELYKRILQESLRSED